MIRTVNILISGRVQGVGFRWFTKNKAQELGVKGTVQNREDGRVEIIAQAEADILEPFIQWCHKGSITARVDNVEIIKLSADTDQFSTFEII
jgi:acylphosphatase